MPLKQDFCLTIVSLNKMESAVYNSHVLLHVTTVSQQHTRMQHFHKQKHRKIISLDRKAFIQTACGSF